MGGVAPGAFRSALLGICRDLAAQVVRNGEGTRHVIRVTVRGAEDDEMAKKVGATWRTLRKTLGNRGKVEENGGKSWLKMLKPKMET